jgi:hypothetical protein
MMDVFGPLMDDWANGKNRHVENEDDDDVGVNWCHSCMLSLLFHFIF